MSAHYLATLHDNLVPTDAESRLVQDTIDKVMTAVRRFTPVAEVHPAGSWAKSTMLTGRKEADVVAILRNAPEATTLDSLSRHLDDLSGLRRRPDTSFKAVNLHFMNGVSVDLLPVARDGRTAAGPSVPRKLRHALRGIEHVQWLKRNAHGTVTHQVIRLAKHLRNSHRRDFHDLSSFAIEVMCVQMSLRGSLDAAFTSYLENLAGGWLDNRRLIDPVDPNNDLLAELSSGDLAVIRRRGGASLNAATAQTWSAVFPADSGTLPPPAGNLGGRTLG